MDTKVCTECNRELPANTEYFHRKSGNRIGLRAKCKKCRNKNNKKYYKKSQQNFNYDDWNRESLTKKCTKCERKLPATKEYFSINKQGKYGLQSRCKKCRLENAHKNYEREAKRKRKWYENNKKKAKENSKKHYKQNKGHYLKKMKEYRKENKEKIKKQIKEHYKNNKEDYKLKARKRHHKKKNLPADFSKKDWQKCKEYFNYKCAYCGKKLKNPQKEHFIPVSKGGGFTVDNIVPACISCNNSKSNNNFFEWYPQQDFYSEKRENKILTYLNKNKQHSKRVLFLMLNKQ